MSTSNVTLSNKQLVPIKNGILKGLEVASGAKSSSTYYHKKEDQIKAVQDAVQELYNLSKELPLILANQAGSTGFFIQQVLLNEFIKGSGNGACNIVNTGVWYDDGLEEKVILNAIKNLEELNGIPYVLRLFVDLKTNKVNNARSRRIALTWIFQHSNLEFIAIKYRNKLREILTHSFGRSTTAIIKTILNNRKSRTTGDFAFKTDEYTNYITPNIVRYSDGNKVLTLASFILGNQLTSKQYVDLPLIAQFYAAKKDLFTAPNVPEEVLLGIISDKTHPQYTELWNTEQKRKDTLATVREKNKATTANVKMRQTKKNKEIGAEVKVEVEKVTDFLALYKTGYETSFTKELNDAIDNLASRKKVSLPYTNIGVIVDRSLSMKGHKQESKWTPISIVDFTSRVLDASCGTVTTKTEMLSPVTGIADSFLAIAGEVESENLEAIFILTDGYENEYDGLLDEVITAWKELTGIEIPIYQVSPIVSSEKGAMTRGLSNSVSTLSINSPASLAMQVNAKLLEQDIKKWLENEIKMLSQL